MKNRRDFLKFIGIGAGAAASVAIAVVAGRGGTPTPPPQAIVDLEAPKPYIGPDGMPGGDFIKRKPDILRDYIPIPEIQKIGPDVNVLPVYDLLTTTGVPPFEITSGTSNVVPDVQSMTITLSPEMQEWNDSWNDIRADHESLGAGW